MKPARLQGYESKHRQEEQPFQASPGRWELNPGRNTLEHTTPKHRDLGLGSDFGTGAGVLGISENGGIWRNTLYLGVSGL